MGHGACLELLAICKQTRSRCEVMRKQHAHTYTCACTHTRTHTHTHTHWTYSQPAKFDPERWMKTEGDSKGGSCPAAAGAATTGTPSCPFSERAMHAGERRCEGTNRKDVALFEDSLKTCQNLC
eukprot:scaffold75924_cov20-Tisochrysis_lutea.AAC.3